MLTVIIPWVDRDDTSGERGMGGPGEGMGQSAVEAAHHHHVSITLCSKPDKHRWAFCPSIVLGKIGWGLFFNPYLLKT